jgi:pimeloyl-ACP methyl ester carboxylesterase
MLLRFAFVGLLAALVMIAVSGVVYEKIGEWQDRRHFPQIGRSVDIGGRTLNLYCSGQGSPTVILESGHSISGLGWAVIQPRVASFTRACWYDRAGYGWSDSGSFPQHSNQIAQDLHRLLTSAGERPPYVLAGHLFGAFNVRAFQHFYPQEVAGMVLIDPSNENSAGDNPTIPTNHHVESLRPAMAALGWTLGELGLWRLRRRDPGQAPAGFSARDWEAISVLENQPQTVAARMKETPLRASAEEVRAASSAGDIPLIVLSPADMPSSAGSSKKLALQAELSHLSSQGRQIVLPAVATPIPYENSTHMTPFESPDDIVAAIHTVVSETESVH